jgi:hypothetical protein
VKRRPIYETETDRDRQRAALERLAKAGGMTVGETGKLAPVDGVLTHKGSLYAVVEYKWRKSVPEGEPVFVAMTKAVALQFYARALKCRALFVVEIPGEGLGVLDIDAMGEVLARHDGRGDRPGDDKQKELMLLVPRDRFRWLREERDDG